MEGELDRERWDERDGGTRDEKKEEKEAHAFQLPFSCINVRTASMG